MGDKPPYDMGEATDCYCVPGHACDCNDARVKAAELTATFNLRWKADMRAIQMWQEAHPGNELVWPDHADLVVWLLEQLPDALSPQEGRGYPSVRAGLAARGHRQSEAPVGSRHRGRPA